MQLLSVGMWGYRRFAQQVPNMDLAGRVVAIVGPNEAGKTSFLRGMLHLNGDGPFEPNEFTRRSNGEACVRAVFALDDSDRAEIADLNGGADARTVVIWKREGGALRARVEPKLKRDLEPRQRASRVLARISTQKWARSEPGFPQVATTLEEPLSSSDESLTDEQTGAIETAAATLRAFDDPPRSIQNLAASLEALVQLERTPRPAVVAAGRLLDLRPEFLFFADEHRQLGPVHNIDEAPTTALNNLLTLAGLNLSAVRRAISSDDQATVEELLVAANAQLASLFQTAWSQANLTVRLRLTGAELHVLVSSTPGRFVSIAERSEGLRHFVALVAYVERFASRDNLMLLIDEAETHLHYDAQADLVKALTNQTIAGKVVYSTHSAGCLPEDLGLGVRMIEPVGDPNVDPAEWEHSRVQNRIWTSEVQGGAFSPLLIAMGATTFAFTAARFALVAEGLTDAILLPTLFREAVGVASVGFQVAPGIAQASDEALGQLDLSAAKVAYLVDSDGDGERHRQRLIDAGVSPDRILRLGRRGQGLSLEDLIEREVYLAALGEELDQRHGLALEAGVVPDVGRAPAVDIWCRQFKANGEPVELSKRAVVQRVLEKHHSHPVLAPGRAPLVRRLHARLAELLEH